MVPSSFMISQITPGRVEAGQAREVDRRLRLAGALQDAAGLGLQREHVAGLDEVARGRLGVDGDLDRVRAVGGRDPGRHALAGLDRHGEGGLEGRLVLGRHEVEPELVAALGRERQADEPAALLGHEVDRVGRGELRRHGEVALVLAVLVVADDDHAAGADVLEGLLDRGERGAGPGLAHASRAPRASRRTWPGCPPPGSPASRGPPRRGSCARSVSGISDTANVVSVISATVSETPSTATEPFSTT